MLCEKCGKEGACIHYTQIINGKQSELHLCAECGSKMGYWSAAPIFGKGFFEAPAGYGTNSCPLCGQTLGQFKSQRKMGCEKCYSNFSEFLEPIMDKIQLGRRHIGKMPRGVNPAARQMRELDRIKAQLADAVKAEEYEKAATLRDKIRKMENAERNDAK